MYQKIKAFLQNKKYAKPIIIALFFFSIATMYHNRNVKLNINSPSVLIEVATATLQDVPIYLSALGTVTAQYSANIVAQVNGQLSSLNFQDGQIVKKDDLLAIIDSRSYEAQLAQYEGQLLRDQALLDNANIDLQRYQDLWKQNSIAKQTLDTQKALVKQYEGIVKMDQGLVENAKTNLDYCNVRAPFDGTVGIRLVTEGNILQASGNNVITVMNMLDPIFILFSIPSAEIAKINHNKDAQVEAYDQNNKILLGVGELKAIDNQIDITTGTIKLKAEFKNNERNLFPNQFVNIRLKTETIANAVTIPSAAIQYGPKGSFVYLVENDHVKVTYIKVSHISENNAVIESGLSKDQVVATTGVDRLIDGSKTSLHGAKT